MADGQPELDIDFSSPYDAPAPVDTRRRGGKVSYEQLLFHSNAYKAWANHLLAKVGRRIDRFVPDLADGVNLLILYVLNSGVSIGRFNAKPSHRLQKLENVATLLRIFSENGLELPGSPQPDDIVDWNEGGATAEGVALSTLVDVMFAMIRHFHFAGGVSTGGRPKLTRQERDEMMGWLKDELKGYRGVVVTNLDTSFRSGIVMAALVNKEVSDAFPFSRLDPKDASGNVTTALTTAQERLGLPALFDADDMQVGLVDEPVIVTWLAYFKFKNRRSIAVRSDLIKALPAAPESKKKKRSSSSAKGKRKGSTSSKGSSSSASGVKTDLIPVELPPSTFDDPSKLPSAALIDDATVSKNPAEAAKAFRASLAELEAANAALASSLALARSTNAKLNAAVTDAASQVASSEAALSVERKAAKGGSGADAADVKKAWAEDRAGLLEEIKNLKEEAWDLVGQVEALETEKDALNADRAALLKQTLSAGRMARKGGSKSGSGAGKGGGGGGGLTRDSMASYVSDPYEPVVPNPPGGM